jgi:6-phosphofructokinase
MLAARLGSAAVQGMLAGETDVMVGLKGQSVEFIPLVHVMEHQRAANMEYYDMARKLAH